MPTIQKFAYTLSHPEFYESLDHFPVNEDAYYRGVRSVLPKDWHIVRNSIWFHCLAPTHTLPNQGWKIHVSAVTGNASDTFNATLPILIRHDCSFKFAADPNILFLLVSKQWTRGGSGKFMTIYPRNQGHFKELIEELHQATRNLEGPYILSDRRYKDSKCIFFRYGGISGMSELMVKGDRYPYILSPSGEKIPDHRQAFYRVPEWVDASSFGETETPAPSAPTLKDGRYAITSALRHTNTGGIYLAWDKETVQQVVIKEARPKTNVDINGTDAISLLRKEYRLLRKLANEEVGPRAIDFFEEWEHSFLVEEFLDGVTLRQHSVLHNVTRTETPSVKHVNAFYAAFKSVFLSLNAVIHRLANNAVVFRDLSPTNVLILKDGHARLVDFEAAIEVGVDTQSNLFTPGFASPDIFAKDKPDYSNDLFSLGALMFAYLMPIHAALGLDDTIHTRFIPLIGKEFGLPESLVSLMLRLMDKDSSLRPPTNDVAHILEHHSPVRTPEPELEYPLEPTQIQSLVEGIVQYTLRQATCERMDRLFPADPMIFVTNPLSVGYGACGVAMTLARLTSEVPESIQQWILNHPVTTDQYPPGLLLGMSGIAWTLLDLENADVARAIIEDSRDHPIQPTYDLFYGLAGQGMASLHFYEVEGKPEDLTHAIACGDRLIEARSSAEDGVGSFWTGPDGLLFGLARGASGIALFLLYLHLATGQGKYLDAGRGALEFDLAKAIPMEGGLLWPSRAGAERTVVPYFEYGSVGVGAVLLRYHRLTGDRRYLELLQGIKRAAIRRYAIFPHKSFGLAGLGDFLIDMANHGIDEAECMDGAHLVARGVLLFKLERDKGSLAFPGDELWKISCDYLTGSAGIGLFLNRLHSRATPEFFLDELFEQRKGEVSLDALRNPT